MNDATKRTIKILQGLDQELFQFSLGNQENYGKIIFTVRWLNKNLEQPAIFELIDTIYLSYADTIKALLKEPYLDPKTNA